MVNDAYNLMCPEIAAVLCMYSDQRLAERVCVGSERAFDVLYDRHHRPLLAFCKHMLGSREDAEDALQYTFMAAYRELRRSGPPAAIRPWLFVVARNRCISVLRARREDPRADVPEDATDHLASEVAAREELRAVLAGVARLPDDQRAALVLTELGGVSHDEIARILGCRREQVKSYVYQARTSLVADRVARETSCAEIREQLSALPVGPPRRVTLRRHLCACSGCREYREALRAQRRQLGLLLPVAPSLGLKRAVLGATLVGGSGGTGGLSLGGFAATALIVVAIPAGGVAVARGTEPAAVPADVPSDRRPATVSRATTHSATTMGRRGPSIVRGRDDDSARGDAAPEPPKTTPVDARRDDRREPVESDPVTPKTTPGHDEPAPVPGQDQPKSTPGQHEPKSTPGQHEPKTTSGQGDPNTTAGRGTPKLTPAHGKPATPPARRTPALTPGHGNSDSTPSQGKPDSTPSQGKPSTTPGHGTPATTPGRADPASPPAAPGIGGDAVAPAALAPASVPDRGLPDPAPQREPARASGGAPDAERANAPDGGRGGR